MRNPLENMPRRGECGIVWKFAKDGRPYCVRKARKVCPSDCRECDDRPKSMYLKGKR